MSETYPEAAFDRLLFDELYGAHPEAIIWLQPAWNDAGTTIADFAFTYSNAEGYTYIQMKPGQLTGLRVSNTLTVTDRLRSAFMEELTRVYLTRNVKDQGLQPGTEQVRACAAHAAAGWRFDDC
jgi:hypothetical protein